jgi:glyoxylate reductase
LLTSSDFVSLHLPVNDDTSGFVDETFLQEMKNDSVLINTCHGDLVNEQDLLSRLNKVKTFWYGTDVYQESPMFLQGEWSSLISKHHRAFTTHNNAPLT